MELAYRLFIGSVVALAALLLGIHILRQDPRKTPNRLALLVCLCLLERYSAALLFLFAGLGKEGILALLQVNSVFRYLLFPLLLHFYLYLKEKKGPKAWKLALIYLPAAIFLSISFFVRSETRLTFSGGRWHASASEGDYALAFIAYQVVYVALTLWFSFRAWTLARLNREKRQAAVLLGSMLLYLAVSIGIKVLFRDAPLPPDIGLYSRVILLLGLYYAVARYRFLAPTPALVTEELIAHMNDMVLLLDGRQAIIMANQKAAERLGVGAESLKGLPFSGLTLPDPATRDRLARFFEGKEKTLESRIAFKADGGVPIPTLSSFSKVLDSFADTVASLVVSRELRGRKEFQARCGLSGREMEILDRILSGSSARETGEALGISPRTVETHVANICAKAGTTGKAELFALCAKFNLLA